MRFASAKRSLIFIVLGLAGIVPGIAAEGIAEVGHAAEPDPTANDDSQSAKIHRVELQDKRLDESSGVCVSSVQDVVWTHNDSGDDPRVFAFSPAGKKLGRVEIKDARAKDWEDMCCLVRDGHSYLAIGDVGDNAKKRDEIQIYIVREPQLDEDGELPEKAKLYGRLTVKYPDGAHNCEMLAYDSRSQQFWLASKEKLRSRLYVVDASELKGKRKVTAELRQTLILPVVTGGDISRDGQQMVLCTYGPGILYSRASDGTWKTALSGAGTFELPPRKQGEAICFGPDGKQLFLTSEFEPTPMWTMDTPQ